MGGDPFSFRTVEEGDPWPEHPEVIVGRTYRFMFSECYLEHPPAYAASPTRSDRRLVDGRVIGFLDASTGMLKGNRRHQALVQFCDTVTFAANFQEPIATALLALNTAGFTGVLHHLHPGFDPTSWWIRLQWRSFMELEAPVKVTWPHVCHKCGSPAQHLFNRSECSNSSCVDHRVV
jgi:hypothetical protein